MKTMKRKASEKDEDNAWSHGLKWLRGSMIGKGSSGSVFLATLKNPKSRFCFFPPVMAVKSAEVSVSGSIQKEKEVLNNLQTSPHIIKCFGEEITTNSKGDMVYNLFLEFASGGTLADHINKSSGFGLPESVVKRYTKSILEGLNHIHNCGYVHCDLKPNNILLVSDSCEESSSSFVAKIGDFGLSKRVRLSQKRKLDPYLRGTAMYLSPEALTDHIQGPPSDIWALGCIVLEMLTGKSPWDRAPGSKTKDLLRLICDKYELPKIPTSISKDGRNFLKACLVRNAKFRLTTEMLLDHPFVSLQDDNIESLEVPSSLFKTRQLNYYCSDICADERHVKRTPVQDQIKAKAPCHL